MAYESCNIIGINCIKCAKSYVYSIRVEKAKCVGELYIYIDIQRP